MEVVVAFVAGFLHTIVSGSAWTNRRYFHSANLISGNSNTAVGAAVCAYANDIIIE